MQCLSPIGRGKKTDLLHRKKLSDLKVSLPRVKTLSIGCAFVEGNTGFGFTELAHTHVCKEEPGFRKICLRNKEVLDLENFNKVLIHEYAHLLATYDGVYWKSCKAHSKQTEETQKQWGHGEKWQGIMRLLGHKPTLLLDLSQEEANRVYADIQLRFSTSPR